jgi:DNA-binding response OmpR family regulator
VPLQKPVPLTAEVVKLLLEAADQGRVVVLTAGMLGSQPSTEAPLVATCRLKFDLTRGEARALVQLLNNTYASWEELHAAITDDNNPRTQVKGVSVIIHHLRKKLVPHGIKITVIRKLGYSIDKATRDEVCKQLAEYGGDNASVIAPRSEEAHG